MKGVLKIEKLNVFTSRCCSRSMELHLFGDIRTDAAIIHDILS